MDLLLKNARLPEAQQLFDVAVSGDRVSAIREARSGLQADQTFNCDGNLLSPRFVDSHFHLDAALSLGTPRTNNEGTLLEGIKIWNEYKDTATVDRIKERAIKACHWAIAQGIGYVRSHVDVCDDRLLGVEALLEVKRELAGYLQLQLIAFPQDGYLRSENAQQNVTRALRKGVDGLGGIPHIERSEGEGKRSIRLLCELAAENDLVVDMHCDESDDPLSRHIEELALQTQRIGLQGKVAASHLTSMHSMDNYYVSKLLPLMAESDIQVIANPLTNVVLQGRHDTYPKRRGLTRIKELRNTGINVALGHDCVMDPWYPLGTWDMLDVAFMGGHVGHMTTEGDLEYLFDGITRNGARVLGIDGYGIRVGQEANMVLLQAESPVDAIRLRANRLLVISQGNVISKGSHRKCVLEFNDGFHEVDFRRPDIS